MSYYKRLYEVGVKRYDQEVERRDQARHLRVYYTGLVGILATALVATINENGFAHSGMVFWIFAAAASTSLILTIVCLALGTCPRRMAYWPLLKQIKEYADGCHHYHLQKGAQDPDAATVEDVDELLVERLDEFITFNHLCNNVRSAHLSRCFFGIVLTGLLILGTFVMAKTESATRHSVPSPTTGDTVLSESENKGQASQPSQSGQQASSNAEPKRPKKPDGIYIMEGRKEPDNVMFFKHGGSTDSKSKPVEERSSQQGENDVATPSPPQKENDQSN